MKKAIAAVALLVATSNPAITMLPFMTKVSYDPQTDFIPVAKVSRRPSSWSPPIRRIAR